MEGSKEGEEGGEGRGRIADTGLGKEAKKGKGEEVVQRFNGKREEVAL